MRKIILSIFLLGVSFTLILQVSPIKNYFDIRTDSDQSNDVEKTLTITDETTNSDEIILSNDTETKVKKTDACRYKIDSTIDSYSYLKDYYYEWKMSYDELKKDYEVSKTDSMAGSNKDLNDIRKSTEELDTEYELKLRELNKDMDTLTKIYYVNRLKSFSNGLYNTTNIIRESAKNNDSRKLEKYIRRLNDIKCPNEDELVINYNNLKNICIQITEAENLTNDKPFVEDFKSEKEYQYILDKYHSELQENVEECNKLNLVEYVNTNGI